MKTQTKIIAAGFFAIAILIAMKPANRFTDTESIASAADEAPTHRARQLKRAEVIKPEPQTEMKTQTITYDLSQPREQELIDKMNVALLDLGIQKDERTCKQLIHARIKANWALTPPGPDWADSPMWQKYSADSLKSKIAFILNGTNAPPDALTIKAILEVEIAGATVPPMDSFEIRE